MNIKFIDIPETGGEYFKDITYPEGLHLTFAFVRHPLSRFIALHKKFNLSIYQFADRTLYVDDRHETPSIYEAVQPMWKYTRECNWVGRYENINNDIASVCADLNLTKPPKYDIILNDWQESFYQLDPEAQEHIIDYYRKDFNTFNYEIPNNSTRTEFK